MLQQVRRQPRPRPHAGCPAAPVLRVRHAVARHLPPSPPHTHPAAACPTALVPGCLAALPRNAHTHKSARAQGRPLVQPSPTLRGRRRPPPRSTSGSAWRRSAARRMRRPSARRRRRRRRSSAWLSWRGGCRWGAAAAVAAASWWYSCAARAGRRAGGPLHACSAFVRMHGCMVVRRMHALPRTACRPPPAPLSRLPLITALSTTASCVVTSFTHIIGASPNHNEPPHTCRRCCTSWTRLRARRGRPPLGQMPPRRSSRRGSSCWRRQGWVRGWGGWGVSRGGWQVCLWLGGGWEGGRPG
jgi:hypothetical protein